MRDAMKKRDDGGERGNTSNLCVAMRTFLGLLLPPEGEEREGKLGRQRGRKERKDILARESSPGFLNPVSAIIPTSTIIPCAG